MTTTDPHEKTADLLDEADAIIIADAEDLLDRLDLEHLAA